MSGITSGIGRVPNRLGSLITQQGITGANTALLRLQTQLSSLKRVNTPSDDPVAASLVTVLEGRLDAAAQRERNLAHAQSVLGVIDQGLDEINDKVLQAKEIASSQIGVGSDAQTRASQAVVVGSLLDSVVRSLNGDYAGLHYFGGEITGTPPIESFFGGYRYVGQGEGLVTDLGDGAQFPITLGADRAVGALSARIQSTVDLNAQVTDATLLSDLRGPGGQGAALGSLRVTIDDGTPPTQVVDVDLSGATTAGDVADAIESAIRSADAAALGGAFPGAVGFTGERLSVTGIAAGYTLSFAGGATGDAARALGIDAFSYTTATPVSTNPGVDLNPRLTGQTTLGSLAPGTPLVYGDLVIRNGGRVGTVTIAPTTTIDEFAAAVRELNVGARLDITDSGDSIAIVNEVSGFKLAIEEAGGLVATSLGLRTLAGTTQTSVFNDGRGVKIADGQINPVTSLPDPFRNVDFEITLTDGSTFQVDLVQADLASVDGVLARINSSAALAGLGGVFTATLAATGNGIELRDTSAGAGTVSVRSLNGYAAEDLGLLEGTFTGGATAVLRSTDRATIRVDSLLSTLAELREALSSDDQTGITFAGERLDAGGDQVVQARAIAGGRASRVEDEQRRLEDTTLLDQTIKSDLQDLDFIEASTRFSLLQTQLEASLRTASAVRQLSLFNFI